MKKLLQFTLLLLLSTQMQAQEKTITGIVSDENGIPLPTTTVIIQGTTIGTTTNFDGKYTITAAVGNKLSFQYVGYVSQVITIETSSRIINVTLQPDNSLNEVVVSAMGLTRKQNELTYSNQVVRSSQLSQAYNRNGVKGLTGKASGLQVNSTRNIGVSKKTRIILRGNRSLTGSQQALIFIDGNMASKEVLNNLKPKKIKTIDVIKGANGIALYGSDASNGAIIITTKEGNYKLSSKELKAIQISNQRFNTPQTNDDYYEEIVENKFETTKFSPLSTFSIDVDKASYSNIRRMINNGQEIPANAVKIEEMINYFNYNYPQPKDEHPFSINTEVINTPWNDETKLVKIGLQGKTYDNSKLPPSNLTFLIDVSGSMSSSNKLPLLKSAFKLLVNQLREQDNVAIVVYAGAAGVVLEPTSGKYKNKIMSAINNLESGGSTAGGAGIKLAYQLAKKHFKVKGNNRVILATDGDFNVGASSDKDMETLIEEKRKSGVFLSVLGFGYGNYKDSKLEILADKGNGNHAYIDTMQEAQKVFGIEFGGTLYTIAKDVKIQVEFNPNKVQAYRLIGYENRLLDDEDFIDDTKDAGELGSGHTVTALYEVIPIGIKSEFLKEISDLKYTHIEQNQNYPDELLTVKFRYKKPDAKKSIEMVHAQKDIVNLASKDMLFASSVALFGMQIRQSKFHNNSKIEDVFTLAESGRGEDKDGYRSEFIRLVNSYQNLK